MDQQDGHSLSGQCDRQFVAMPDGPIEAICRDELYDHWRLRSGNEIRTEKQAPEISQGVYEMLKSVRTDLYATAVFRFTKQIGLRRVGNL